MTINYAPLITMFALRSAGGNAQDYEDAYQLGEELVLKAQAKYDPTKGDEAQYVALRLSEELEVGRQAVKQPMVESSLPILPDGEGIMETIPADDDYEDVPDEAVLTPDSEMAKLFAMLNLNLVDEAPIEVPLPLKQLNGHLAQIRALPEDNVVRRMFFKLRILLPEIRETEVMPAWTYEVPPMVRLPGSTFRAYGDDEEDTRDAWDDRIEGRNYEKQETIRWETELGTRGISRTIAVNGTQSWRGLDGFGPESSLEISQPAKGWYKGDPLLEGGQNVYATSRPNVPQDEDEPESEFAPDLDPIHPMPLAREAVVALNEWLDGLDKPTKYSRASRKAFILAVLDGAGKQKAQQIAWQVHRKTVVSARSQGLVLGNGQLIPWAKAERAIGNRSPWSLSLDVSREAMCDTIREHLKGNAPALHFATRFEHAL